MQYGLKNTFVIVLHSNYHDEWTMSLQQNACMRDFQAFISI